MPPTIQQLNKTFFVTADTNDLLASDQMFGQAGQGWYKVIARQAAAADGTITINDGFANVVDQAPIPVRAAAVTYPEIKANEDIGWIVKHTGRGPNLRIDISDGTNAEITVYVEKL